MKKNAFRQFTSLRESRTRRSQTVEGGHRLFHDVTIIKSGLGNRRDRNYYPTEVLKEAASSGQFEGLKAYVDHPDAISEETRPERSVRDIAGIYTKTRFKEGKGGGSIVGNLRILKSQKWLADTIDELMEMGQADKIGISINGRGQTEPQRIKLAESGEEIDANVLQKFLGLRSADVVTEAGAGGGFQQLLESARGAKENGTMTKEALKKLQEAAARGDQKAIAKLGKLAEAAIETATVEDDEPEAGAKKGKKTKEGQMPPQFMKGKKKKGASSCAEAEEANVEDPEDEADPDAELDATVDEIVTESDDDIEGRGDDEDDVEEAEGDDDSEESDEDDDEDDEPVEEADSDADADETPKARKKKKTQEARALATGKVKSTSGLTGKAKQVAERGAKNVKGVATSGGGSAVNNGGAPQPKGRQYGYMSAKKGGSVSGRTREAQLEERLRRSEIRNERLAEALRIRQGADRAKKLLKESDIPSEMRPELLRRMVGRSDAEMQSEIRFTQKLLEAARTSREEDFDEIEGAGSSLREGYRGAQTDGDLDALLEGLPLREADDE